MCVLLFKEHTHVKHLSGNCFMFRGAYYELYIWCVSHILNADFEHAFLPDRDRAGRSVRVLSAGRGSASERLRRSTAEHKRVQIL